MVSGNMEAEHRQLKSISFNKEKHTGTRHGTKQKAKDSTTAEGEWVFVRFVLSTFWYKQGAYSVVTQ